MREVKGKIQILSFFSLLPPATSLKRVWEIAYQGGVLDSIIGVAFFSQTLSWNSQEMSIV